jgi:hypothetical protein
MKEEPEDGEEEAAPASAPFAKLPGAQERQPEPPAAHACP